jgi:hypothetical protein
MFNEELLVSIYLPSVAILISSELNLLLLLLPPSSLLQSCPSPNLTNPSLPDTSRPPQTQHPQVFGALLGWRETVWVTNLWTLLLAPLALALDMDQVGGHREE